MDAGLIEALESLIEETESSVDEEENIKTQKLISKAECLKNEILETVAGWLVEILCHKNLVKYIKLNAFHWIDLYSIHIH